MTNEEFADAVLKQSLEVLKEDQGWVPEYGEFFVGLHNKNLLGDSGTVLEAILKDLKVGETDD
jgi:hypothetical protein